MYRLIAFLMTCVLFHGTAASDDNARLIILADMGNEADEEQQMAHMLVNCNEFELEGLIAVTGKFLQENARTEYKRVLHPELFHKLIDGYAEVVPNLRLHADGWPTPDYLHGIVRSGQTRYGLADVGPGKSTEGSRLIARSMKLDDPRPLNIVVNAGSNTLAQALLDLRGTQTSEQMEAMVAKLRVFENGAQDNCGAWICHEFPSIHWIRSNHQTYGYMGQATQKEAAAGPYNWKPYPRTHQGQHRWVEEHIMRGHGALGELYPYRFKGNGFVEGGGTVPWMGLVNKGLYSINHPSWGGWSGRFTATKQKNVWSRHDSVNRDEKTYGDFYVYTEAIDRWTDPSDGVVYENEFAAVWRWRQAMMNNCQTRFDWCVKSYEDANHHPVASVNGDASDEILSYEVQPGDTVSLNAKGSSDPDGDRLTYRWYVYPEAGTYNGDFQDILTTQDDSVTLRVPNDAAGSQIHLILEVTDQNPIVGLTDYRRMVVDVKADSAAASTPTRPNVLLVIVDDMNDYGFGGLPMTKTPATDRFRSNALTFKHAYCAAPVCGPSRASTFSGIYPHKTGSYLNGSDPWKNEPLASTESLPELFRRSGYKTFGAGKLFHAKTTPEKWRSAWDNKTPKGGFGPFPPEEDQIAGKFWGVTEWEGPDTDFPDVNNADHTIAFLEQAHQKPFFLCYGLWRPHTPFTAPKRFFDLYDAADIPVPPPGYASEDLADVPEAGRRLSDIWSERWSVSGGAHPDRWRRLLHGYLATTSFADWNVGRVIEALDRSPHSDNTIVIFWSDNGYHMGEKNHYEKATLWEKSAYTPLAIRVPGSRHNGKICMRPVGSIDLYPTIKDYCSLLDTRHALDGQSLRPLLDQPKKVWSRPALTAYGEDMFSLRTERYRYIRYSDGSEELYDHQTDPHEKQNIVGRPKARRVIQDLKPLLPSVSAKSLGGRNG